jgi:cell wall-associated NlpC family hydrolase
MTRPRPDGGGIAVVLAAGAAVVLLAAAVLAAAGAVSVTPASCQAQVSATATATATIPAAYLADYQAAGAKYGIPWTILAGIGEAETGHGRSGAPGVHSGANPAGAAGPMQFGIGGLAGNTWGGAPVHAATQQTGGYGIDGNRDGIVNVYDPGDAIPSAAAYLRAHGAPGNIPAAVFAYNHSADYVSEVLGWAARYGSGGAHVTTAQAGPACRQAGLGPIPAGSAGKITAYAEAQLGKPYQFGATGPAAFDCSGLAMQAYRAAGIGIPRTSQAQWAASRRIPLSDVRPGDLVFFAGTDGTMTAPGHVGIVTSPGMMIDAPFTGQVIRQESYADSPDLVGFTAPG